MSGSRTSGPTRRVLKVRSHRSHRASRRRHRFASASAEEWGSAEKMGSPRNGVAPEKMGSHLVARAAPLASASAAPPASRRENGVAPRLTAPPRCTGRTSFRHQREEEMGSHLVSSPARRGNGVAPRFVTPHLVSPRSRPSFRQRELRAKARVASREMPRGDDVGQRRTQHGAHRDIAARKRIAGRPWSATEPAGSSRGFERVGAPRLHVLLGEEG